MTNRNTKCEGKCIALKVISERKTQHTSGDKSDDFHSSRQILDGNVRQSILQELIQKNESSDWKTVSRLGSQVKLILDKKRKQAITNTSPKDTVKLLRESVNSRGSWTAATTLLWKTLWRPWDSLTHWFLQKCFLTNGLQPHMIYEKDSLGLLLLWRSKGFNDTNDASDVGCEVCSGAETCKRNANGQQGSWYSISQGDLHASKGGQQ